MAETTGRLEDGELTQTVPLGWGNVRVAVAGARGMRAEAASEDDGTFRVHIRLDRPQPGAVLEVGWRIPCTDAAVFWSPRNDGDPWLPMAVGDFRFTSSIARYAPLGVLLAHDATARMSFAVSETVWPVEVGAGVDDLSLAADFLTTLRLVIPAAPRRVYETEVFLDPRPQSLAAALEAITEWYSLDNQCPLTPPSNYTQAAVYSTWYCFQQTVTARAVEAEAQRARELGFGTVIVDDGWQTHDTSRDYAYCGDWDPDPEKFPDMAQFVARIQGLGMRCMLWIAPPLLGPKSSAWAALSHATLGFNDEWQAAILDPREPAVREHLVRACTRAVEQWNVDGLKIDFLDAMAQLPEPPPSQTADCSLVAEGLDRLLEAITAAVSLHRTDLMVEFRQEYVSPRLWRYGNLLRAFDCPYDAVENRVRTIRGRLLAGPSTAHSDPIAWHPDSTSSDAARHLINAAFGVPQVSMRLDTLSPAHRQVVARWLALVEGWRDVLLLGHLTADRPELNHPSVTVQLGQRAVLASYADIAVPILSGDLPRPDDIAVLNGGGRDRVLLDADMDLGTYDVAIYDCLGRVTATQELSLDTGIHPLLVPAGGTAELRSI